MLEINSPSYATPRTWVTGSDCSVRLRCRASKSARLPSTVALDGSMVARPLTEEFVVVIWNTRIAKPYGSD
ncbi:hypothetical protein SP19_164 [Salmonella phage 19]|nr:hypothetical protein SP19_164 [Salmonella phage 19]